MIKEVKMPDAGQTTDEVMIHHWLVAKGDKVKRGDILLETETDKATFPIESIANGIIVDLLVKDGDTIHAGSVIALIGDESDLVAYDKVPTGMPEPAMGADDDHLPKIQNAAISRKPDALPSGLVDTSSGIRAMPNAKRLAADHQIDLADIKPAHGVLITRNDVQAWLEASGTKAHASVSLNAGNRTEESPYEVFTLSNMRKKIESAMLESVRTIPAFNLSLRIDMTAATRLRDAMLARSGIKLSYIDIAAKAIAVTAKPFPLLNSRYEAGEVRVYRHSNIGVAVAVEGGLVVPVLKNVDTMDPASIAEARKAVVAKAQSGNLLPSDMNCASTTISNLGMYGIERFSAIINPPECSIFALGSIVQSQVFRNGIWESLPMMEVTASFDHRIIDGSYGARILQSMKELLENPVLMLC